ncbi:MAG TPA: deoxyribonuclease V [Dehalococcoidia bacterium]|nr:deoxyribonuclease V [Dehalococcoidia bacterium]
MRTSEFHPWYVAPEEAVAIQRRLAAQVVRQGSPGPVRRVAGADISVDRDGHGRGAVVVLSYPELEPLEVQTAEAAVPFPYVPGLLAFREVPVLLPAFERLQEVPDLLLVDGQGIAHQRRFGIACHLGLILDVPAIGCAKSRLVGSHDPVGDEEGSWAPLADKGESVGVALRTRRGAGPIYVSIGHRIGLEEARGWALRLCRGYRLPEPCRLAHQAAGGTWRLSYPTRPGQGSHAVGWPSPRASAPSPQLTLF